MVLGPHMGSMLGYQSSHLARAILKPMDCLYPVLWPWALLWALAQQVLLDIAVLVYIYYCFLFLHLGVVFSLPLPL
jgi:hypothetical protein